MFNHSNLIAPFYCICGRPGTAWNLQFSTGTANKIQTQDFLQSLT